jgi:hypothetical protein
MRVPVQVGIWLLTGRRHRKRSPRELRSIANKSKFVHGLVVHIKEGRKSDSGLADNHYENEEIDQGRQEGREESR